ncbi:MAG: outer membrane lipoprotein-sorting protein, partial [Acidobacteriota bacterium]|nr:outer membrane lipoprotein-sorting protein [Acidobacteriota bacterium]
YAFSNRTEERELDANGKVTSIQSKTYEAILIEGRPARKLVARNDKPLSAEERNKEQDRLNKISEERKRETAPQREKRLASARQEHEKQKEFNREILNAFDFHLAGEDRVDGRETWILEATPHPGYQAKDLNTQMLAHMKGKLWVDKQDYGWAKIDAEATDTISFGLVLARMDKGARFFFEQTWINNEVWLPRLNQIRASARIGLIKKIQVDRETTFQNYRKLESPPLP